MTTRALVQNTQRVRPVLESINWDFAASFGRIGRMLFDARKYHWYPATYVPEIPYTLIEVLAKPGAVVYDPFGGIGTTLFQAATLGCIPIGTEICRVSVRIVRSLWTLLGGPPDMSKVALFIEQRLRDYKASEDYSAMIQDQAVLTEQLRPWFSDRTFNEICFLIFLERATPEPTLRAALSVALSATLKSSSSQDRGWGCVADNVKPSSEQLQRYRNAFDRFVRNLRIVGRDIQAMHGNLTPSAKEIFSSSSAESVMIHGSATCGEVPAPNSVDLVVTSPPYPQMTDYCLSQRLSYYWMGSEPSVDLESEIGARRKRFSRRALADYRGEMRTVTSKLLTTLREGGVACLIMPSFETGQENHIDRKHLVEATLAEMISVGFAQVGSFSRMLPVRRRQHNQKWASLNKELIWIYQKL